MTARNLSLLFVVTVLAAIILTVPLSAIIRPESFQRFGVAVERVQGSLAEFALRNVRWREHALGDVTLRPSFADLLLLKFSTQTEISGGPVHARGFTAYSPLTGLVVHDADLSLELGALPVVVQLNGRLHADITRLEFDPLGCVTVQAKFKTDALKRGLAGVAWAGPDLSGAARCEGRNLVLPLSGQQGALTVDASLIVKPDFTYEAKIRISNPDETVAQLLPSIGFKSDGMALILVQTGRWG